MTEAVISEPEDLNAPTFQFVGGALCLDFCNTVGGSRESIPREKISSFKDFIAWSEQAGLIGKGDAVQLHREASIGNEATRKVLSRALELREALYRIFRAAGKGKSP